MTDKLEWSEPPKRHTTIDSLRERPGEWAKLREYDTAGAAGSAAYHLRQLDCQAVARKLDDTTWGVWARWPDELPIDDGYAVQRGC